MIFVPTTHHTVDMPVSRILTVAAARRYDGVMECIVVTGLRAVTPVRLTARETWENLLDGRSGVGPIASFDASHLPVRIADARP
jgi:hypothetical protein